MCMCESILNRLHLQKLREKERKRKQWWIERMMATIEKYSCNLNERSAKQINKPNRQRKTKKSQTQIKCICTSEKKNISIYNFLLVCVCVCVSHSRYDRSQHWINGFEFIAMTFSYVARPSKMCGDNNKPSTNANGFKIHEKKTRKITHFGR